MTGMVGAFLLGAGSIVGVDLLFVSVDARADDQAIVVSVNDEGRMRVIEATADAAPGERKVVLRPPSIERPCEASVKQDVAGLRNRVAALEARTDEGTNEKAIAPFEVVNEAGTVVFAVVDQPNDLPPLTRFFDENGARVGTIAARSGGGEVTMLSANPAAEPNQTTGVETRLSAWGEYTDLGVIIDSREKFRIGRREKGNYAVAMFNPAGQIAAGIAETNDHAGGLALVSDASGKVRILLQAETARGPGMIQVLNAAGIPVASLSGKGAADSGLLQLTSAAGDPMVNAEVFPSGVGAVRAGPSTFQHGLMFIPFPASYIQGR